MAKETLLQGRSDAPLPSMPRRRPREVENEEVQQHEGTTLGEPRIVQSRQQFGTDRSAAVATRATCRGEARRGAISLPVSEALFVPEKSRMRRFNSTKVPRSGNRGSYSHVSSRQITMTVPLLWRQEPHAEAKHGEVRFLFLYPKLSLVLQRTGSSRAVIDAAAPSQRSRE
jgi:hypothetical protein